MLSWEVGSTSQRAHRDIVMPLLATLALAAASRPEASPPLLHLTGRRTGEIRRCCATGTTASAMAIETDDDARLAEKINWSSVALTGRAPASPPRIEHGALADLADGAGVIARNFHPTICPC